jgi:acetolactate synthase-1/2/3 large subunit
MNGAESLVRTLIASKVEVCFTNPGTSEMHFVAALDTVPGMRCVLGLFEGVVTGAADGYARMADRPAATLLHLGPGLANGLANLHNARKARSPVVNIVGEHAIHHRGYETPLASDLEGIARPVSHWFRMSADARSVAGDAAEAVRQARSGAGKIATLALPADTAWNEANGPAAPLEPPPRGKADPAAIAQAVAAIRSGKRVTLMMSGRALREPCLGLAARIAAATGVRLLSQQSNARVERGAGCVVVPRVPYPVDQALAALADIDVLLLLGANPPASFFAYPGKPSMMTPPGCETIRVAGPDDDLEHALRWLADELGASAAAPLANDAICMTPAQPGRLTAEAVMQSVAAMLPEQAILCDESVSRDARCSATPTARRRTTTCSSPAGRSARACPWPPGPRSPAPTARWSAWKATAAACTRCRPSGPRRASGSTWSPWCWPTAVTGSCKASSRAWAWRTPASARSGCSRSRIPISTGSRWPGVWASRPRRRTPPRASTTCWPRLFGRRDPS